MPGTGEGNALPNNPLNGTSVGSPGVSGQSNSGPGVSGQSIGLIPRSGIAGETQPPSDGVLGQGLNGVHGISVSKTTSTSGAGVWGENSAGDGVVGVGYHGVHGISSGVGGAGVWGENSATGNGGAGVSGSSTNSDGVHGESTSSAHAGVSGVNNSGGYGVWASAKTAGYFQGDVEVTGAFTAQAAATVTGALTAKGDVTVAGTLKAQGNVAVTGTLTAQVDVVLGSDCAEDFDIAPWANTEPGTVMVLTENGALEPSQNAYDKKVAGVISGAGDYKPGLILGRCNLSQERMPLALVGKVYCKVDADPAPIAIGDLLTTSARTGYGMKAANPALAFGAVIGKALRPLPSGQGMIPILVALQ
jgi:hypothetical protein